MEQDKSVSGTGNSYTTEFRQYDPRLARWKSLDPLMHKFPWMSPYVAFDNNPVYFTDVYGLESEVMNESVESTKIIEGDKTSSPPDTELPEVEYTYKRTWWDKLKSVVRKEVAIIKVKVVKAFGRWLDGKLRGKGTDSDIMKDGTTVTSNDRDKQNKQAIKVKGSGVDDQNWDALDVQNGKIKKTPGKIKVPKYSTEETERIKKVFKALEKVRKVADKGVKQVKEKKLVTTKTTSEDITLLVRVYEWHREGAGWSGDPEVPSGTVMPYQDAVSKYPTGYFQKSFGSDGLPIMHAPSDGPGGEVPPKPIMN